MVKEQPNKTGRISTRIDATLKRQAEAILNKLGVSSSEAIVQFYQQIIQHKGLPFDGLVVEQPAETTTVKTETDKPVARSSQKERFLRLISR